jgi:hypothetical protein
VSAQRICICGGPRVGKTRLSAIVASELGLDPMTVRHTDELVGVLEWSETSDEVARWLEEPGPWVVEGVATIRACRKFLTAHPGKLPCDRLIILNHPLEARGPGQEAMARGHTTIFAGIEYALRGLGVDVVHGTLIAQADGSRMWTFRVAPGAGG